MGLWLILRHMHWVKNKTMTKKDMVTISREEYEQLLKAKNNLEYLKKLDESYEQKRNGHIITKTEEELEALLNG